MSNRWDHVWTAEREQALRDLWPDNALSIRVIGLRLGISKNAVAGKVMRLNLPPRPSPIGTTGPRPPGAIPSDACPAPVVERARAIPQPPTVQRSSGICGELSAQARREAERRQHRPVYVGNSAPLHYPPDLTCQWIEGDLRHGGSYCGGPRVPGRPYCAAHCEVAYVHIRQAVAA
jgi:GcrA cell cycle regulator